MNYTMVFVSADSQFHRHRLLVLCTDCLVEIIIYDKNFIRAGCTE